MYNNKTFKAIFRLYLLYCFTLLIAVLILKFSVYHSASEDKLFQLVTINILGQWIPLMIMGYIVGFKHDNYLKNNYREKYDEMNTVFGFSGIASKSKWNKFFKSKDNFGDPLIENIKKNTLALLRTRNIVGVELVIVFLLIMEY